MPKKIKTFPQSCDGCESVYRHWDAVKQYSNGCMKSFGNIYCIRGKKHFKLLKRNVNYLRPTNCPIAKEFPIVYEE